MVRWREGSELVGGFVGTRGESVGRVQREGQRSSGSVKTMFLFSLPKGPATRGVTLIS